MNPGFGFQELLVLVVIALVVVGPRELPLMVRRVGQVMGQVRATAREFQRSFDELGREAELAELREEVKALKQANPVNEIRREFRDARTDMIRVAEDRPHPRGLSGDSRFMANPIPQEGATLTSERVAAASEDSKTGEG